MCYIRSEDYIVKAKREDVFVTSHNKLRVLNFFLERYIKIENETLIIKQNGIVYEILFDDLINIIKNRRFHSYYGDTSFSYQSGYSYFLQIEYKKKGKFRILEFIFEEEDIEPFHRKREYIVEDEIDKVINHFIRKSNKIENSFENNYITIRGGAEAEEIEKMLSSQSSWEIYDCSRKTIIIACIITAIILIAMGYGIALLNDY